MCHQAWWVGNTNMLSDMVVVGWFGEGGFGKVCVVEEAELESCNCGVMKKRKGEPKGVFMYPRSGNDVREVSLLVIAELH